MSRLRVMAEYGASGVWAVEPHGPFRHGMVELDALRLEPALAARFRAWGEAYFGRLEGTFDVAPFNDEGWALARALQSHLGTTASVVHAAELANGGIAADREVVGEAELPEGWGAVDPTTSQLAVELAREVSPGHPLHGFRAWPFAARGDRDDVLFAVEHPTTPWAIVHVTWRRAPEPPPWPSTELFATFAEAKRVMELDV